MAIYSIKPYKDDKNKLRLEVPGVNFGYGDSNPIVVRAGTNYLLVQVKGVQDWSGRGESKYYPPEFHIYKRHTVGRSHQVESPRLEKIRELWEFKYTRKTRNLTLQLVNALFNQLEAGKCHHKFKNDLRTAGLQYCPRCGKEMDNIEL